MKFVLLSSFLSFMLFSAPAQDATQLNKKTYNLQNGVAIDGYDPVAYFTMNKAVKGSKDFAVAYEGVVYYFTSEADKELFKKNSAHYIPSYGGWCAYAMGKDGSRVEVDPETFKIIDGRLFLFYNKFFNNTLKSWNKDEISLHKNADANWTKFYH